MDVAAVITACGFLITSAVTSAILWETRKTGRKVTQIDHAVNGQPAGTKPMVDQVQDLHAQIPQPLSVEEIGQADLRSMVKRLVVLAEDEAKRRE